MVSVVLYVVKEIWSSPFSYLSEASLVGLAFDLVDKRLSFSAMTVLLGHVYHKIVPENDLYNVLRGTLNPAIPGQYQITLLSHCRVIT